MQPLSTNSLPTEPRLTARQIADRCEQLVPGISALVRDNDVRFGPVHFSWSPAGWVSHGFVEDPVDSSEDVVMILWDTFGSLLFPRALFEILAADARKLRTTSKVWESALEAHAKAWSSPENKVSTRAQLVAAMHLRGLDLPVDLVMYAVTTAKGITSKDRALLKGVMP